MFDVIQHFPFRYQLIVMCRRSNTKTDCASNVTLPENVKDDANDLNIEQRQKEPIHGNDDDDKTQNLEINVTRLSLIVSQNQKMQHINEDPSYHERFTISHYNY